MEKYIKIISNSIQASWAYRFNIFTFIFSQFIIFGIFFYLWSSIYYQGGKIGSYNLSQIVFYYLGASFIAVVFAGFDGAKVIGEDIRQGRINDFLVKPISYFNYKFSGFLAGVVYRGLICIVCFAIIFWLVGSRIDFSLDFSNLFFFFISATLGLLINYLIFYLVGISTFWFGFVAGFNFAMQMIIKFLDGSMIPLDLLPQFITNANDWLPFKYIVFVPISIFTGRLDWDIFTFLIPAFWMIILYLLSRIIFKLGLKEYEGFGS